MGFYDIPDSLEKDIADYEALTAEFTDGKINKAKMKAARVPMGVYEQRKDGTYMVRARIAGGDISPLQLKGLVAIAQKYTSKPFHLTTRQELQFHDIALADTHKIMKELREIGLSTRGGGGNTVRNITGSFDEGIDAQEAFSVSPYIRALTGRMIAEPDSWVLPRKFKIAFSGSSRDTALAALNDLGFIAKKNEKGEKGFMVYIAGGMGTKPAIGTLLYEFAPHTEVYNITRAAKQLFDMHGNRKNKHAARLRFVLYRLGKDEFIKLFEKILAEVRDKKHPVLQLKGLKPPDKGYVMIPVFLGDLSFEIAGKIAGIAAKYGEETIRLTPGQNIMFRNLPEKDAHIISDELAKTGVINEDSAIFDSAVVCAGAATCRLGICLSRGLIKAAKEKWEEKRSMLDKTGDVIIRISGCPNTCGQHMIADIGFYGAAKRHEGRLAPAYYVMAGGVLGAGKTKFARQKGVIFARNAPDFLLELLEHAQGNRKEGESFAGYIEREGGKKIDQLLEKYNAPKQTAAVDIYTDWHAEKEFSLADRMEGECSAGVFDLIDYDFTAAENSLAKGDAEGAVAAASRALLITKGLEAKTGEEAVRLFNENFIGKHMPADYAGVAADFLSHAAISPERALEFLKEVKKLYNSMDNSLRFPEIAAAGPGVGAEKTEFRDFRGVKCPMNFVKTKLVLEGMKAGEKLEILLDDGEPIENVPASLKNEGHEILNMDKRDSFWSVLIKKGG
jgi:sulfite reductase (ferredoxin)